MIRTSRDARLVRELASHGLLLGHVQAVQSDDPADEITRCVAARQELADDLGTKPPTEREAALAIVAGARATAVRIRDLEIAAARFARLHGVTVRDLAEAAGITERAATTRYALEQ